VRTGDLLGSAVGGLWRQKARTALTLTGVAVGGCALAFSLSLGIGLRALIDHEFRSRPGFWQVYVHPSRTGPQLPESEVPPEKLAVPGDMSPDRARRLRAQKLKQYRQSQPSRPPVPLTEERLAELAAHPDVTGTVTVHGSPGTVRLGGVTRDAYVVALRTDPAVAKRLVAGRLPAADTADECLVSEFLLYDLGAVDEAAVAGQVGKPLRVVVGGANNAKHLGLARLLGVGTRDLTPGQEAALERVTAELPAAIDKLDLGPAEKALMKAMLAGRKPKDDAEPPWLSDANAGAEFRVVGVVRPLTEEEEKASRDEPFGWPAANADVLLPRESGNRLFNRLPWIQATGYETATLTVRPGGDLKGVADHVEAKGFTQHSGAKWYTSVKREVTLIAAGLNLFALVSLFVAATGITNTLVTSVVERTREIGVLKALGATDRQVMLLFLTEGSVIGLLGGLLGLGLAWALSIPGDGFVRKLIQDQSPEKLVSDTVFEFPTWLIASTVLFAAAVTTLAALYPARRAARVLPVEALRYE
jgi:putative ABC transport system permease protein